MSSVQCQESNWASLEFLLGMFNDYNGIDFLQDHSVQKDQLTFFWCSHKKKSELFVEQLEKLELNSENKVHVISDGNIKVLSPYLINSFKKYFKIERKPKSWQVEYESDNEIEYGIYKAKLKCSKFNSKHKKFMFLSGAIIRYGELLNHEIVIMRFANSPNHYDASLKFLKRLNFQIIEIKECDKNMVPCIKTIKFRINDKYSDEFEKLKMACENTEPNMNDCG